MRVLITGIDGFVGSHAAELILRSGAEVHGTIIKGSDARNLAHVRTRLTLHEVEISDTHQVQALISQVAPERILHIAGQAFVPNSLQNPMETFQTNVMGGLNILEAARQLQASSGQKRSVLVVSSSEVYGRSAAGQAAITEATSISPSNPYAASKASIDLIAQQYAQSFEVDVIVVRPFNHIGSRQNPIFVVSNFAKQFAEIASGKREPVIYTGNTSVKRDFTNVRDVVRAYWMLFDRNSTEVVFNVASGVPIAISDILQQLQAISETNVRVESDPERVRDYDVPVVVGSHDRLSQATGWTPQVPLHETLREVYSYWVHQMSDARVATSAP
ncbi:MAG: GDP-mannose 4,6-dehydratase [Ignavibacteriae bacterium]|nr:GDP-mannose 4,6-dehydratase [Ignavibacteriota bacterium]